MQTAPYFPQMMQQMAAMTATMVEEAKSGNVDFSKTPEMQVRLMLREALLKKYFLLQDADRLALTVNIKAAACVFDYPDELQTIVNNFAELLNLSYLQFLKIETEDRKPDDPTWFSCSAFDILMRAATTMELDLSFS